MLHLFSSSSSPTSKRAAMGKKLDAMLNRNFKPHKFRALVNISISRIAILKKQRQPRCFQSRSDVVQLLKLGNHDSALIRVEQVIKEQNMLHVLDILEGYCNLLVERIHLIEQEKICPGELREAVSGLLYASSRCGDIPELQGVREALVARFGKEFAAGAIELRRNCGVTPQLIQKLSTQQPSWDNKMEVLKRIATDHNITLQLEEPNKEDFASNNIKSKPSISSEEIRDNIPIFADNVETNDEFSDSMRGRKKFIHVADAAQAAFKSAAYAAEAARAAVELSHSQFHDPTGPGTPRESVPHIRKPMKVESKSQNKETEDVESKQRDTAKLNRSHSDSSSEYDEDIININIESQRVDYVKLLEKNTVFDDGVDESCSSRYICRGH